MKVRKLGKMVLREEFFAITGCLEDAMILNQMCYWSERVKDIDKFLEEEYTMLVDHVPILAHGWIYKSASELTEEMFGAISEKTMNRVLDRLVKNSFLRRRVNPNPKYRFDKTYQYRVNFVEIIIKLQSKNMPLSGYQIIQECAERINNGVAPIRQNDASDTQVDGAIPEITTETTNKELPLTPSKGNVDSLQVAIAANGAGAQVGKADALSSRPSNSVSTRTPFRAPKSPPTKPADISDETWAAWCDLRKAKRAAVTAPVIAMLRKEADKAGWSLNSAMEECVLRNWQGFKADWLQRVHRQESQQ
jgi:hypothetical protein